MEEAAGAGHLKDSEDGSCVCAIRIIRAKSIAAGDSSGTSDPYARFSIGPGCNEKLHWKKRFELRGKETKWQNSTLDPVWNETLNFNVHELKDQIVSRNFPLYVTLELWDRDDAYMSCNMNAVPSDEIIGYARIPLHYFVVDSSDSESDPASKKMWFALFLPRTLKATEKKVGDGEEEEEDDDSGDYAKYHMTDNAGEILLEFTPAKVDFTVEHDCAKIFRNKAEDERLTFQALKQESGLVDVFPELVSHISHEFISQLVSDVYLRDTTSRSNVLVRKGDLVVTSHRIIFVPSGALKVPKVAGNVLQVWVGAIKSCKFKSKQKILRIITHAWQLVEFYLFADPTVQRKSIIGFESFGGPLVAGKAEPANACFTGSRPGATAQKASQSSGKAAISLLADHFFWSLQEEQFFCNDFSHIRWDDGGSKGGKDMLDGEDLYQEYSLTNEFARQFDGCEDKGKWKQSVLNTSKNENDRLCSTYPDVLYFPADVGDDIIHSAAEFRKKNRVPALTYWYKKKGGALCRSSQPKKGITNHSDSKDIELIRKIAATTRGKKENGCNFLYIVDCRSTLIASTNAVGGGGTESTRWYSEKGQLKAKKHYCNIGNIHAMRKSLNHLTDRVSNNDTVADLKRSSWFKHVKLTLKAGYNGYHEGLKEGYTVLVHCSDGWDRTAQVCCLIQIFADPYFRTIKGFCTLVAKDFCAFGHKFSDRGGYGRATKEESPIFLQFLDCVYQLAERNKELFEFKENMLLFLGEHMYSHLFPDFLYNSEYKRCANLADVRKGAKTIFEIIDEEKDQYLNDKYSSGGAELQFDDSKEILMWEGQYRKEVFEHLDKAGMVEVQDAVAKQDVNYFRHIHHPDDLANALKSIGSTEDRVTSGSEETKQKLNSILAESGNGMCLIV